MKRLVMQAAIHIGFRGLSVILSFMLFSWVGKILLPNDAVQAYQFLFMIGFAIAASRACFHFSSRIVGTNRATDRLRRLYVGFSSQVCLLPPLGGGVYLSIWLNTGDSTLALLALAIFMPAAFDVDAVRSFLGRPSYFALAQSLGSAIGLVSLAFFLPHTLNGVVTAFSIQWLPLCALNIFMLIKHTGLLKVKSISLPALTRVLVLASFDGVVLNAPFFGLVTLEAQLSLDISLIIRIFTAALPMLPLLLHWSNSPDFPKLCNRFGLSTETGFLLTLLAAGLFFGYGFALFYYYSINQEINLITILGFTVILSTFSVYFSRARFSDRSLKAAITSLKLLLLLVAYLIGLILIESVATVFIISIMQGAVFLVAPYLILNKEQPSFFK